MVCKVHTLRLLPLPPHHLSLSLSPVPWLHNDSLLFLKQKMPHTSAIGPLNFFSLPRTFSFPPPNILDSLPHCIQTSALLLFIQSPPLSINATPETNLFGPLCASCSFIRTYELYFMWCIYLLFIACFHKPLDLSAPQKSCSIDVHHNFLPSA